MLAPSDRERVLARRVDFYIHQGATYNHRFVYVDRDDAPIDLSAFSARLQMRAAAGAAEVLYEATTADGDIDINAAEGELLVKIAEADNRQWTFVTAVYDLELVGVGNEIDKIAWGRVRVKPEVTR